MNDNTSAYNALEYDERIKKTLPYYEEFYKQVIDVVKTQFNKSLAWLDIASSILNLCTNTHFDVITAIQVFHYFERKERIQAIKQCYEMLYAKGIFITFENFAPHSEAGKKLLLERWKSYQLSQGKDIAECNRHIDRYGKEYFPISILEHLEVMEQCGFKNVEIIWVSNMQVGLLGIK